MDNSTYTDILLVEDDMVSQKAMAHFFKSVPYTYDIASTGEEALEFCEHNRYRIVLLDCELPGIKGYEVSEILMTNLKENKPAIFLLTAYADKEPNKLFHARGIDLILQKPVKNAFLKSLMQPLIHSEDADDGSSETTGTPLLLVVEDDPVIQQLYMAMLKKLNVSYEIASDGKEGSELADKTPFSLILTDLSMPVMDGHAFARYVRDSKGPNAQTPIVAVTALDSAESMKKSNEAGIRDTLVKPFNLEMLTRLIKKWLPDKVVNDLRDASKTAVIRNALANTKPVDIHSKTALLASWEKAKLFSPDLVKEMLEMLQEGGNDLIQFLIGDFLSSYPEAINQIEKYVKEDNLEQAKKIAHMFKSRAGSLGFVRLQTILEHAQCVLAVDDATTMPETIAALRKYFTDSIEQFYSIFPQFRREEKLQSLTVIDSKLNSAKLFLRNRGQVIESVIGIKEPSFLKEVLNQWLLLSQNLFTSIRGAEDLPINKRSIAQYKAISYAIGADKLSVFCDALLLYIRESSNVPNISYYIDGMKSTAEKTQKEMAELF